MVLVSEHKPCPWCKTAHQNVIPGPSFYGFKRTGYVFCEICKAQGPAVLIPEPVTGFSWIDEAWSAWDRRAEGEE